MALFGSLTTFAMNKVVAKILGATDFTPPATLYFGWHFATTLSSGATSGTNTISTANPIAAGANLIIAPVFSTMTDFNTEQHVVFSSSGSGPYTITLTDNLAHNHLSGCYVAFDPGDNCAQFLEHVGDNYSRVSKTNNTTNFPAPTGGESDSGTAISSPTPSATWGLATHMVTLDASSGGNAWIYSVLQSFLILDTSTAPPLIAAGNLITRAQKPS